MAQQITLKIKGLFTNSNEYSSVPEGALSRADNIVIDKESVAESRRGLDRIAHPLPSGADRGNKCLQYQGKLLVQYGSSALGFYPDSSSAITPYSGSFSPPDTTTDKTRSAEANSNFYFTSSTGIKKLDSVSGTPVQAGMYKGLDSLASLSTNPSGFLATNTQVAYRVVWGITDANNNLILGAPSQRAIIANASGGSSDVSLAITIPTGVTVNHFFQVYRSTQSASSSTTPDDNMQLVYEANSTSGQIVAKTVTVIDSTPDSLRGAALYTNDSQEGILQANELPPYASDLATFRNCLFLANIKTKQRLNLTLISAGLSSYSFTVSAANATAGATYTNNGVTFTVTTTIASGTTLKATSTGAPLASGTLTKASGTGDATITFSAAAVTNTSTLQVGDTVTIAGTTYTGKTAETIASGFFQVATAGSPAQNINDTALSLIRCINQSSTNTQVYAYYLSGSSSLPGQILVEERILGGNAFVATASAHGGAFQPNLPTSGTTVTSTNNIALNGIMNSKQQIPEAVPLLNIDYAGSASERILRIIPLRDSLFILKTDGIYRVTGTSPDNFSIDLLDNTAILIAPETAVAIQNSIFALTTQGVVKIDDTGVAIISEPIQNTLLGLAQTAATPYQNYSWGLANEADRKFVLFTVSGSGDTSATQAYCYNIFTKTWTRWSRSQLHGIVLKSDGRIYASDPLTNNIVRERKDGLFTDFADETLPITITAVSGQTITLADVSSVAVGDIVYQSLSIASRVTAINPANSTVTVNDVIGSWSIGSTSLLKAIACVMEWVPCTGQNPGTLKHWSESVLLFKQNYFGNANLNFYSDVSGSTESQPFTGVSGGWWGRFLWGLTPWGGVSRATPFRTYVPSEKQRCDLLSVQFACQNAWARFQIEGLSLWYEPVSERVSR